MLLLLEEIASSSATAGLLATTFYYKLFLGHDTSSNRCFNEKAGKDNGERPGTPECLCCRLQFADDLMRFTTEPPGAEKRYSSAYVPE
jgi:hypothetical protein